MFRKRNENTQPVLAGPPAPVERVTSVLGQGIVWKGSLSGSGGLRIEGSVDGDIHLRGLLVVGETGRVTGNSLKASVIVVAGAVRADLTAEKVEIRSSGRVWGNVTTAAFATEEGAFLRGMIRMEERVEIGPPPSETQVQPAESTPEPAADAPAVDDTAETVASAPAAEAEAPTAPSASSAG